MDLARYLPGLLLRLSNKLSSGASRLYRERFDLGVTDWRVLAFLGSYADGTAAQLCHVIGLDKGAVSRSLTELEQKGLITTRPEGTRNNSLALTESGKQAYAAILPLALARQDALLDGFSREERAQLIGYCHRLLANLQKVDTVAGTCRTR